MATSHGRHTQISVGAGDISTFCKTSEVTRSADKNDVTGYGVDDYEYGGDPLKSGEFTASGTYHTGVLGPAGILKPLVGTIAEVIRKPEGTGTGKPTETFDCLIEEYKETAPVADYVQWGVKGTRSGPIVDSVQA